MSAHPPAPLLRAYAAGDPVDGNVDAHLLACPRCRADLAALVSPARMAASWEAIADRLDAPAVTPVERLLTRLGMHESSARLVAATPALQVSWTLAVAVVVAFAALVARVGPQDPLPFLTIAPLPPLLGIATAYGPRVDPTHEIGLAAPVASFRLFLLRAAAVLAASTGIGAVAGLASLGLAWTAVGWLLPALALVLLTLLASSVVAPVRAAAVVGGGWVAAVLALGRIAEDPLVVFGPAGQVALALVAAAAGAALVTRRAAFDQGSPS